MKTYAMKASEINKKWFVIDAEDLVLGRLAAVISKYLKGKHKPEYSPYLDCGDNIVVINARKVHLTGRKLDQKHGKKYIKHTGYMGGIKETMAVDVLNGAHPERIIKKAVERMLSKNKMAYQHLSNLYVYPDSNHKHAAQQPEVLNIAELNIKNTKRS